jgi:hypothetical protein
MASAARRATTTLLAFAAGLALSTSALGAQGQRISELTISGFPLTVTGATTVEFEAGAVALGSTSFSIDLTKNTGAGGFSPRITTVNVQCGAPCPASGGLSLAGLQWRRADLGTWNTLTTTYALIETRTATFDGTNDPWGNSVAWRYQLSWTGTPPAAATQFNIQFQLVVTSP